MENRGTPSPLPSTSTSTSSSSSSSSSSSGSSSSSSSSSSNTTTTTTTTTTITTTMTTGTTTTTTTTTLSPKLVCGRVRELQFARIGLSRGQAKLEPQHLGTGQARVHMSYCAHHVLPRDHSGWTNRQKGPTCSLVLLLIRSSWLMVH